MGGSGALRGFGVEDGPRFYDIEAFNRGVERNAVRFVLSYKKDVRLLIVIPSQYFLWAFVRPGFVGDIRMR